MPTSVLILNQTEPNKKTSKVSKATYWINKKYKKNTMAETQNSIIAASIKYSSGKFAD